MIQLLSNHAAFTAFNGIQEERNSAILQYFSYLRPPLYTLIFALYLLIFDIVPIYYSYLISTHFVFVISISLMVLDSCCVQLLRKCEFELFFYIAELNNKATLRKPPAFYKVIHLVFKTNIARTIKLIPNS